MSRRTGKTSLQNAFSPCHYQLQPYADPNAGQRFARKHIFDTEAQTLATANHLDCGNFDDMLRKAFEHENIDSAFKINGLTPIYIRFPMLAMFLTGTPSQMASLIETSEKGLPSRILLYTFRSIPEVEAHGR